MRDLLIAVFLLSISTTAFSRPVECPHKDFCGVIKSKSACDAMGGDWDAATRKCTIYISEGADNEGDPNPPKAK